MLAPAFPTTWLPCQSFHRVPLLVVEGAFESTDQVPCWPPACGAGAFENTVQALYKYVVPKPKSECTKGEQLGVSFGAGYIAGVLCAVVSHPADNLVSKMNAQKGVPVGGAPDTPMCTHSRAEHEGPPL